MTTTKQHLIVFNASELSELWRLVTDNFNLVASVLGLIAFIGWIAGFRPRTHRISHTTYIDFESNQILEEVKFRISWGHVFFLRKIKLPRIERNANFRILCKPLGGMKDVLHMDNYSDKSSGLSRNIYLVNKDFFGNNEIEDVFLEITRPAPQDYRDKIEKHETSEKIEILNWNHVEVRGFAVELPKAITLDKIPAYSGPFVDWKIPTNPQNGITVFLKSIPSCMGGKPGKATIPLI